MGLIGIIIASLVNIFLGSSALQFAISVIGVLVFVGLTAYDTQRIKEMYYEVDGADVMGKKAIMGALRLYLDFINLFMMLLQLFGAVARVAAAGRASQARGARRGPFVCLERASRRRTIA